MTESISSDLLARYLAGEALPEERATVETWAASDPAHARELERLRALWVSPGPAAWDVDRAWARTSQRLTARQPARPPARLPLALAATIAVALGAVLVWRVISSGNTQVIETVMTEAGERRTLDLPDRTRITLAPGSSLRVDPGYGGAERRVDLEGEAWFDVRHDASRPFRVHVAGTVIEDLGTEFSVRALAGTGGVRVVVVSGRASLRRAGTPSAAGVTLDAGDVGTLLTGESMPRVERDVDVGPLVGWRDGRLDFDDAPLDSVAVELSRWYGVTFRIGHPGLESRRLTAPFRLDDLEDAIEVLTRSLGIRAERQGDVVVLK